eukprot:XP_024308189.1 diamine acetyltransferase 1 isoform X1 [Homo sapiens]
MKAFSLPECELQQTAEWPVHSCSLTSVSSDVCFLQIHVLRTVRSSSSGLDCTHIKIMRQPWLLVSVIHACVFFKTYDRPLILQLQLLWNVFLLHISCDALITGHSIVGFAMYYFTYDPWIGKLLYLEDFFVMSDYRGFGIGSEILKNLSQVAMRCRCSSMHFLVAEWNEPSINFYKRRGASDLSSEEGWRLFKIDKEYLLKMATEE